ncbi:MAG: cytochrome c oxidase subunit 3 [Bacillota bacterium]
MTEHQQAAVAGGRRSAWREIVADFSRDVRTYPFGWSKAMMWIFILSDLFVFGGFLAAYAGARMAATQPWPDRGHVFSLTIGGAEVPLLLIAIMTFILISSSGTVALSVAASHERNRSKTAALLGLTLVLGACFLGMQAYEWTHLIHEGFLPSSNPAGASQFGATFFMITGFHGTHVAIGLIFLARVLLRVLRGYYDRIGTWEQVEVAGLYWHFVDLVWVFIFAFIYLI